MYRKELTLIFDRQQSSHATLKDLAFRKELFKIIFKQRPLKLAAGRLGRCSLEPQRTRARKAWPQLQRFRYWQDLNNIAYTNRATGEYLALSIDDKQKIAAKLEQQKTLSWASLKK